MSEITFEPAAPVAKAGSKSTIPAAYIDGITRVAGKVDDNKKPLALKFTHTHGENDLVAVDRGRIERQLRAAGKQVNPDVTVRIDFADANTEEQVKPGQPKQTVYRTVVTFWTVPKYKGKVAAPANAPLDTV